METAMQQGVEVVLILPQKRSWSALASQDSLMSASSSLRLSGLMVYRSGVSMATPISSRALPYSLIEQIFICETDYFIESIRLVSFDSYFRKRSLMSDEEEDPSEEEEEEDQQNEDEDEEDEEDQDDQDDQDGDQDEDQDQDEDGDDEDEDQDQDEDDGQEEDQKTELPKFKPIEPEGVRFTNLLSEISSLSMNVDHFICSLPSHGGPSYRSYQPPPPKYQPYRSVPQTLPEESRIVMMKDEDTQVSMQPQIVIQPTKVEKNPPSPAFKASDESTKFLAQLYQENKKLKRWSNSSHNMNTQKGGSTLGGFHGSRQKFERQQYEKGLFDVDQRNKEIDQAIYMLRQSQQ